MNKEKLPPEMFGDLFEQTHVSELLVEWSNAPDSADLFDVYSDQSYIRRKIHALEVALQKVDKTNGACYQAEILAGLDYELSCCHVPSDLKAVLPKIKELLLQAHIIAQDLNRDALEPNLKRGSSSLDNINAAQETLKKLRKDKVTKRRKDLLELVKLKTEWSEESGQYLTLSQFKLIKQLFRKYTECPEYKEVSDRTLNKDAKALLLRPRRKNKKKQ